MQADGRRWRRNAVYAPVSSERRLAARTPGRTEEGGGRADASPSARAARRYHERVEQGDKSRSMNEILHSQIERDQGDRERPVGAMEAAKDAITINTDGLSLEKVVEQVLGLAHDRGLTSD